MAKTGLDTELEKWQALQGERSPTAIKPRQPDPAGWTNTLSRDQNTNPELDAQAAGDRAALSDANSRLGTALADVGMLVPRAVAGAADFAVNRPLRAMGVNVGYMSPMLVPSGADVSSMTPFYDTYTQRAAKSTTLPTAANPASRPAPSSTPVATPMTAPSEAWKTYSNQGGFEHDPRFGVDARGVAIDDTQRVPSSPSQSTVIQKRILPNGQTEFYGTGTPETPAEKFDREWKYNSMIAGAGLGGYSNAAALRMQGMLKDPYAAAAIKADPRYTTPEDQAKIGEANAHAGALKQQGSLYGAQTSAQEAETNQLNQQMAGRSEALAKFRSDPKYFESPEGRAAGAMYFGMKFDDPQDRLMQEYVKSPSLEGARLIAQQRVSGYNLSPQEQAAAQQMVLDRLWPGWREGKAEGGVIGEAPQAINPQPHLIQPPSPMENLYQTYAMNTQAMGALPIQFSQFVDLMRGTAGNPGNMGMGYAYGGLVDDALFDDPGAGRAGRSQAIAEAKLGGKQAAFEQAMGFDNLDSTTQRNMTVGMESNRPAGGRALRNWEAAQAGVLNDATAAIKSQMAQDDREMAAFRKYGQDGARYAAGWDGYEDPAKKKEDDPMATVLRRAEGGAIPVSGKQVLGPGTGKSDSIPAVIDGQRPAALSTGEYVFPVEAVKYYGMDKLNKMKDKAVAAINSAEG